MMCSSSRISRQHDMIDSPESAQQAHQPVDPPETILVVDDTLANLHVLFNALSRQGYEVRCAKSGFMGLVGAQTILPDLILLDIRMPNVDGYEVCRWLKADSSTSEIPVIFLSVLEDADDKVRAFEVGGADYITKPFQIAEVLARVKHQLTIRKLQRQQAQLITRLEQANRELQDLVNIDSLTQISNRRHFDEYLTLEWQRSLREQLPLSLILADIDHFKRYYDTCGHLAGDRCLQQVAKTIQQVIKRPTDLFARYGGEEFAVLLPNTTLGGAAQLAETICARVKSMHLADGSLPVCEHISLSLGVASVIPSRETSFQALLAAADEALYAAKSLGRDRIYVQQ